MKTNICLLVIASLFLLECNGVILKYSSKDPCMMLNINANLSLTMSGGKLPLKTDATLDGAVATGGECNTPTPSMTVSLSPGSGLTGTLTLTFTKGTDSKVNMDVQLGFLPDTIFKNNDNKPKTIKEAGTTQLSKDTASYTCSSDQEIKFSPVTANNYTYDLKMTISDVQIQAFNLQNGKFSAAEDCSSFADVSTEGPTTQPPAPTTQPPAPTTQPPAPTTQPPAQTTDAGNQTVAPPSNETTTAPTTMPPKNESTTEAPTTKPATTMVPTTTEPPTPKPGSPATMTYKAAGVNGTCVLIQAGIEFKIPYVSKTGNKTAIVGIPSGNDTTATGNCMGPNKTQSVTVTFYDDWTLTLKFAEASDSEYYLSDANLVANLNAEIISDISGPVPVINVVTLNLRSESRGLGRGSPKPSPRLTRTVNQAFSKDQFKAAKDGSYKCNDETTVNVGDGFEMNTYNFQYAAFQTNITAFSDDGVSECSSDTSTNSVVPIAVGAALAGLVVIVLIAYLIGRKRSRQSGYEQV